VPEHRGWAGLATAPAALKAPTDVLETPDALQVVLDLPGLSRDAIGIQFENGTLTVEADRKPAEAKGTTYLVSERRTGKIRRTFSIEIPIDAEKIEAGYDNGVLTVTLPKQAQARPRKIDVQVN